MVFGGRGAIVQVLVLGALGCGSVVVPDGTDGGVSVTISVVVTGDGRVTSTNGLDCPGTCEVDVVAGTRVTLDAEPGEGRFFAGFDLPACGADASCAFTATEDRTITARFEVPRARLRVVRQGDGQGRVTASAVGLDCGATCEVMVPVGTEVALTAEPDSGSRFGAWGAPCVGAGDTCTFTLDADTELRATFDDRFATLSVLFTGSGGGAVRSNPAGLACTSTTPTCEATFEIPTTITLTATPDPATTFVGWSESTVCSGRQPCTLPLQRSQTVTATFEGITNELTITRSGPGQGRVVGAGAPIDCGTGCVANVPAGTAVDLVAEPARHYRFVRWTGACSGTSPTCALTMDTPKTADAEFEFIPQLATGFRHACATSTDGRLRCWGANDAGQLGYGHMIDVGATPTRTPASEGDVPIDRPVESLGLGFDHTCAVLVGGAVRCWGRGDQGQLGYGDALSRGGSLDSLPRDIGDVALAGRAAELSAGSDHTCALLETGDVQCWGTNVNGALGYGDIDYVGREAGSTPLAAGIVPMGERVVQLVSGAWFNCARLADASVRCWGGNQLGQLGYGDRENRGDDTNETPAQLPPVPVGGDVDHVSAMVGAHACAHLTSGDTKCWGLGVEGRLGYGNDNDLGADPGTVPSANLGIVHGLTNPTIVAGGSHTCGRIPSGSMKCWGWGLYGQLGYGDANNRGDTPSTTPGTFGFVDVGAGALDVRLGGTFTCVRVVGNNVVCWGANDRGQLGQGDTMNRGDTPGSIPSMLAPISIF